MEWGLAGRPWDGGDVDRAVDGSAPASPPLPVADDAQKDQRQHYGGYGAHPRHTDAFARGFLQLACNRIEGGCRLAAETSGSRDEALSIVLLLRAIHLRLV